MLLLLFETELPPTEDEPLSVELLTLFPAVAVPCKYKNKKNNINHTKAARSKSKIFQWNIP